MTKLSFQTNKAQWRGTLASLMHPYCRCCVHYSMHTVTHTHKLKYICLWQPTCMHVTWKMAVVLWGDAKTYETRRERTGVWGGMRRLVGGFPAPYRSPRFDFLVLCCLLSCLWWFPQKCTYVAESSVENLRCLFRLEVSYVASSNSCEEPAL